MSWLSRLREAPEQAVDELLRGVAEISPYEREEPHGYLLQALPRSARRVSAALLGSPALTNPLYEPDPKLADFLDEGLRAWLTTQRQSPPPAPLLLNVTAQRVCEALQWPLYFKLPRTLLALATDTELWLEWARRLSVGVYRDPEFDYWQVRSLAQVSDALSLHWRQMVVNAGRSRSIRYRDLGLYALARMPASPDEPSRNIQLQIAAMVARWQKRRGLGVAATDEFRECLADLQVRYEREPAYFAALVDAALRGLFGDREQDRRQSLMAQLGFSKAVISSAPTHHRNLALTPPGSASQVQSAKEQIHLAQTIDIAWRTFRQLMTAHEDYAQRSGDGYFFVRTLDNVGRLFLEKFSLEGEERMLARILEWIRLALALEPGNPRLWMLWQLALRRAGYAERAGWVLWEMVRRFPDQAPCRVELARLCLAEGDAAHTALAKKLLAEVLLIDPKNLHTRVELARLANQEGRFQAALELTQGCEDGPVSLIHAQSLNRLGRVDEAIAHLRVSVKRFPSAKNLEGYLNQIERHHAQGSPYIEALDPARRDQAKHETTPELDPAWLKFRESVQSFSDTALHSAQPQTEAEALFDTDLPKPTSTLAPAHAFALAAYREPTADAAVAALDKLRRQTLRAGGASAQAVFDQSETLVSDFDFEFSLLKYLRFVREGGAALSTEARTAWVRSRDQLQKLLSAFMESRPDWGLAAFVNKRIVDLGLWFEGPALNAPQQAPNAETSSAINRLIEQVLTALSASELPPPLTQHPFSAHTENFAAEQSTHAAMA